MSFVDDTLRDVGTDGVPLTIDLLYMDYIINNLQNM